MAGMHLILLNEDGDPVGAAEYDGPWAYDDTFQNLHPVVFRIDRLGWVASCTAYSRTSGKIAGWVTLAHKRHVAPGYTVTFQPRRLNFAFEPTRPVPAP